MTAEELRALAVWLEELASIDSAAHFPDSAAKHSAAARVMAAMAKLEELGSVRIGHMWPKGYEIDDEPVDGDTLLEAIEAAERV